MKVLLRATRTVTKSFAFIREVDLEDYPQAAELLEGAGILPDEGLGYKNDVIDVCPYELQEALGEEESIEETWELDTRRCPSGVVYESEDAWEVYIPAQASEETVD